ncbi:4-hydroxy-tetrahydrodipicolinate synthase [Saccharothrix algeriensis]|uniref:4-hydroxy-tetrahydrodipicolinate synthase n=1 Tax=Saccharothrix algeriensis TaxID=173560 RepID=A0A8T8HZR5_9PSEU|nr:4-hydroxy-tetrahydrodipicolinate synthase [Saccharothrix algeriensis]MBM7809398.1 4-hydroxy-tetrahydrodipicolinate synthase [Saccharothrix algeriensis]QTR03740.1 4-hydroxy-tetrahydrodipicolinate synthase [Saccharothrix algeriensis]
MRFRSDPASIRGSIAPVITPFTAEGALDTDSLRALVRWQKESGSHGVSIGGSTGEPSAQSLEERITAMRVVAEELGDAIPFLPGTGAVTLDATLELTDQARKLGADLALVITPYYSRPTQEGLFAWYDAVAREFPDLPIVIYNVPSRTAVDIAPDTVARLRNAHDNIVGIKETTKDFEHFSHVLHKCGRDFLMWSGIELLCLPLLAIGGVGFVSALANLAPAAVARMYELYVEGDHQGAIDLHYRLSPLVELLFVETNPAPAKHVLADLGRISSAHVRPPLVQPTPAGLEKINALRAQAEDLLVPSGVNA